MFQENYWWQNKTVIWESKMAIKKISLEKEKETLPLLSDRELPPLLVSWPQLSVHQGYC